jgi:succinyl-diaminopimelate desuccinylase
MTDDQKQLLRWIDDDRQKMLDFYSGFIRAKSPNPPGNTRAAIAHVASFLDEVDLPYAIHEPLEGAPNIVASFEGVRPGRHLILNGHADVFPVGREELWERDPFSGDVENGRIHGRGSSDMKGGSTAAVFAYAYLHRLKDRVPGRLTLMIVSDEETGGTWGSKWLIDNLGNQVLGDCVLSGEPGGVGTVRYGEKGIFQFTVSVKTRGAHGPYPHLSGNAIRIASRIMDELERLQEMVPNLPASVAESLNAPRTREMIEKTMGRGTAEVMKRLTVNIGTIRGGSKINMVAADCAMEVDIRIPIGIDSDEVLARVQEILGKHPEATLENLKKGSANYCDPGHRMARIIDASACSVGLPPLVPIPSVGGSDCRLWRERGIPAYVFGTTPHNIAAPNESTSIEDFMQVVRVHALSSYAFLAGQA